MTSACEFSCIIPVRNEGLALEETLGHLRRLGSPEELELILVDDASARPVAEQFDLPPSTIIHRCSSRQGTARARNIGASLAQGKVLLFLDAHVCFSHNVLEELNENGVAEGTGIFGCTTRIIADFRRFAALARGRQIRGDETSEQYHGWRLCLEPLPRVCINRIRRPGVSFPVPYVGACALAISKSLFSELGGFDEGLAGYGSLEDAELAMRCWSFGHQVQLLPVAICHHFSDPAPVAAPADDFVRDRRDHPRYDGSFFNALRVMCLHFPDRLFADVVSSLNQEYRRYGWPLVDFHFPSEEMDARRNWLDVRRLHNREWLIDRMTRV